jgi:hypothetical protein
MNLDKILIVCLLLTGTIISSGCMGVDTKTVLDFVSPVILLKGSTQYCIQFPDQCEKTETPVSNVTIVPTIVQTPVPTFTVEPTIKYRYVNPYETGERWQGQWFRWVWLNTSGTQSTSRGIVIYGHNYYKTLTQWNDAKGNYQTINASKGNRFLAVYVHQEDFGPDDTGMWGYDSHYFNLQYSQQLHPEFVAYNKTLRIIEIEDSINNYYNIERVLPFGIKRIFAGYRNSDLGGYYIETLWAVTPGKGNAWDGYILYEVPIWVTDDDIRIVGNFANRPVNWRFDSDIKIYPASQTPSEPPLPIPTTKRIAVRPINITEAVKG